MISEQLKKQFEDLRQAAEEEGVVFVGGLAHYESDDRDSSTCIITHESKWATQDHQVMDVVRDLMVEWHNAAHQSQLEYSPR